MAAQTIAITEAAAVVRLRAVATEGRLQAVAVAAMITVMITRQAMITVMIMVTITRQVTITAIAVTTAVAKRDRNIGVVGKLLHHVEDLVGPWKIAFCGCPIPIDASAGSMGHSLL